MRIEPITTQYLTASLNVISAAFPDGHEAELVTRLRQSATYHPEYDVVALNNDGVVIGHAMLSQATVADQPVFMLAPLAVQPDWQHQGVGGALLTYLEVQAGEDARRGIALFGDPAYYGRFGYQPASDWQITPPAGTQNLLFKELLPGSMTNVHGELHRDPAFN